MSIIVDFYYDYWGDNGRCHESKLEEFDSELEAISDLGFKAFHTAIQDRVTVDRVIGGEDGAMERINAAVSQYVTNRKRQDEIAKLRKSNEQHRVWLANVSDEIIQRGQQIKANEARIAEIDNEDGPK